jgi:hypothetical protein
MNKPKRLIPFREGLARIQKSKSGYYNGLKTDPTLPRVVKPNGPRHPDKRILRARD